LRQQVQRAHVCASASWSQEVARVKPMLLFIQFGQQVTRYDTPTLQQHYHILHADDGAAAIGLITRQRPVLLLVLVHIARPEDITLCAQLAQFQIPILALLTATLSASALADLAPFIADFLIHPAFSGDVLDRITVVRSRQQAQLRQPPSRVTCGTLLIDLQAHQVSRQLDTTTGRSSDIHLTPIEWSILAALVRVAGTLVWHEELCRQVGTGQNELTPDALRVHIRSLRQKLGDDPNKPQYIFLERGKGYRFAPVTPVTQVAAKASTATPIVVPADRNAFIGRIREQEQLMAWLADDERRLITITGPAGVGKTRLCAKVANAATTLFPDGVFFVSLAATTDPKLLLEVIAQRLGLQDVEQQPIEETLTTFLQPRTLLLVLDNFEHLIPAATWLGALLDAAPRLKILVTSQIVLCLYGEHEFVVPPLAVPASDLEVATIGEAEAVKLFVRRAEAAKPSFKLSETNAGTIAKICRYLEGLPLAIELAAAQVASMQPKTILVRLRAPLALLTHDLVDRSPRQTALRQALDWSLQLLAIDQQRVFFALSVFVGGWTVAGAAAVCVPLKTGVSIEGALEMLRRHSLIQRSDGPDDEPRYSMLEVIRVYAHEQLIATKGLHTAQQRHASYLGTLAAVARQELSGPTQVQWLARLEVEHDNVRAALEWSLTHDLEGAAQLCGGLWQFWLTRGYLAEAHRWLSQVAYNPAELTLAARGLAFNAAGIMAQWQGNHGEARVLLGNALSIRQQLGARSEIADTRMNLASTAQDLGEYDLAQEHLEAALQVYRELGNAPAIADALNNLGLLRDVCGEYQHAQPLLEEALVLYEAQQDTRSIAQVLGNLGQVARNLGDLDQAVTLLQASLHLRQQIDDRVEIANALLGLGIVATMRGGSEQAQLWLRESLELYVDLGMRQGAVECLEAVALWLAHGHESSAAVRILSATTAIRQREGKRRNVTDTQRYTQLQDVLQDRLGGRAFDQLARQSQHLTLDQTVALARNQLRAPDTLHAQELG
jgi:predicted ATPase/DNA-binding response OmpR family regulator/Tfp pilus assembly protein PilF